MYGLNAVEMAEHANGGAEQTPATAVKDATAAPAPGAGGREVDFKKLSQPEAFKLLKVRHCLPAMQFCIVSHKQTTYTLWRHVHMSVIVYKRWSIRVGDSGCVYLVSPISPFQQHQQQQDNCGAHLLTAHTKHAAWPARQPGDAAAEGHRRSGSTWAL